MVLRWSSAGLRESQECLEVVLGAVFSSLQQVFNEGLQIGLTRVLRWSQGEQKKVLRRS